MSSVTDGTFKSGTPTFGLRTSASNVGTIEKFEKGQNLAVGTHKVEIVDYLTEGGFAQIYVVKFIEVLNEFDNEDNGSNVRISNYSLKLGDVACLKRVLVYDEVGLNEMRNEVNVMKKLRGCPNIVQYYDSNATRSHNGNPGYEVLLLMELCSNNSLLNYMNQRLATQLSEKEVLKIMYDVTSGVAQMHYLKTPLIHRDIKIENVLVDSNNNFKLCDFGSATTCPPVATTHQDIALLGQNVYVHTTPQYRSPEMIDLYRYLPINEKSDIWALGVFLYKLLFYTTPFETTGQFAMLHSKFDIPANKYSSKIINLVIIMLSENLNLRPNIYQVMHYICQLIQVDTPILDIYGRGPYNFSKYSDYQKKAQAIQNQLFASGQNNSNVMKQTDSVDDFLNDFFLATFEAASKLDIERSPPTNAVNTVHGTLQKQENLHSSSKSARTEQDFGETYYPPFSEINTYLDKELNPTASITGVLKPPISTQHEASSKNIHIQTDLDLLNVVTNQRQKSISSYSSGGNKSMKSVSRTVSSSAAPDDLELSNKMSNMSISKTRQHKSNNPFPNMLNEYPPTNNSITHNYFLDLDGPAPQLPLLSQIPSTLTDSENTHGKMPFEMPKFNQIMNSTNNISQRDQIRNPPTTQQPQQRRSFFFEGIGNIQPTINDITINDASEGTVQTTVDNNADYFNDTLPGSDNIARETSYSLEDKGAPKPRPQVPLVQPTERSLSSLNNQKSGRVDKLNTTYAPLDETLPTSALENKRNDLLNLTFNEMNFSQESMKESETSSTTRQERPFEGNTLDRRLSRVNFSNEDSIASSESININLEEKRHKSAVSRKISENKSSSNKDNRRDFSKKKSPVSRFEYQNNNERSLTSVGRHSLDLKVQEVNFTGEERSNNNLRKEHSAKHSSKDIRRTSFARARQSLDIERLRSEMSSSSTNSSKKRSIFSMFKSDRK
ncbi:hypothetical protein KAFR_0C00430 [Kazachstania africana CBS 2517]|uniref:Protein kinase domain-containing protein n=1 Tax=Kazachstania africana (strain ATCC 22294 / BCRC 22015 / CBS 2517 / CECT 1963 / NBRC 1671 / NRRL Y-8276) TaxID=1071382 RepID=H2ARN8_KAZAF|nr:hypothetical protein KAFR_0C00430 [Kazachstania africana CBS 2517]CCF57038.1 hypothetical protein KAFR_0C00430 [Kazachstania africana CBS 2517]